MLSMLSLAFAPDGIRLAFLLRFSCDQHRARRMLHDALRVAALKEACHTRVAVCLDDDQIRIDLPRDLADSVEYRDVIADVTVCYRDSVLLCQFPKLLPNSIRIVLAERDHRHWNRRARRHETDRVPIFVDVHEMNGGAKTLSEPLGGFDRPPDISEKSTGTRMFLRSRFFMASY